MNKAHRLTIAIAAASVLVTGCVHPNGEPNNTATGALVGAGGGAAFGAAMGAAAGGGRGAIAGALLGGAFGAITGTIIGNQIDQQQEAELREEYPATYAHIEQTQPLTVADVEALAHAKVSDDVIIGQIQKSQTVFHLGAGDIIQLHAAGVSDKVVNFMIATVNAPVTPSTVAVSGSEPPPAPDQPVVAAPAPGYVWIGGEWQWNGYAWVWAQGQWIIAPWPGAVWAHGYWYRGPFGGWRHAPGRWH
jgi:hypothetical protein